MVIVRIVCMPNPRKYFEHGELYLITTRTEDGLPFKNSALFSGIFQAILARSLSLYPVELVAFTLETNHLHILLCAINPEDVPLFVGYVKQELSHAVNRLRGREKKTIWCEGYDSPVLLGEEEAFYYLTYLYTQTRSGRTTLCNSWEMFFTQNFTRECKRRHRTNIKEDSKEETYTLKLSPYAFAKKLCPDMPQEKIREQIVSSVIKCRKERIALPFHINEQETEVDDAYVPKKRGRRSYCICWQVERRVGYLSFIRASIGRSREVLSLWRRGYFDVMWPAGFFPPSAVRRANVIPD